MALAGRELADVVGQNAIQKGRRAGAADGHFAHVRDVEDAGGVADGQMFVGDAGVLDGHFPAAELDEFAAELLVRGVEGGAFEHDDRLQVAGCKFKPAMPRTWRIGISSACNL